MLLCCYEQFNVVAVVVDSHLNNILVFLKEERVTGGETVSNGANSLI